MNRKIAIALALAATAAGSAFADDITVDNHPFVSSLSRAEVAREYLGARAQVAALTGEDSGSAGLARGLQSTRSRAEATGEYIASRNQVAAFTGEDSGSAYLARSRASRASTTVAGQPRAAQ